MLVVLNEMIYSTYHMVGTQKAWTTVIVWWRMMMLPEHNSRSYIRRMSKPLPSWSLQFSWRRQSIYIYTALVENRLSDKKFWIWPVTCSSPSSLRQSCLKNGRVSLPQIPTLSTMAFVSGWYFGGKTWDTKPKGWGRDPTASAIQMAWVHIW